MSRKNRNTLADRVIKAAEAALAAQDYVSPIDVLVRIGWLDAGSVERWRRGQIDCLERVVQTNLPRISEAMKLFRSWATGRGLFANPTHCVTRTPRRQTLRFSRSGDPTIEGLYRTRWVSRGRTDPSRAFGSINGVTTRLTARVLEVRIQPPATVMRTSVRKQRSAPIA